MTLITQISRGTTRRNERNRERYALARELGLTAEEAMIAAHWSVRRIREYAELKMEGHYNELISMGF